MKKYLAFTLGCLLSAALFAQNPPMKYSRATIFLDGKNIVELARLGLETDHGELRPGISLTSDFSADELVLVRSKGFRSEVLIEDVIDFYQKQNKDGSGKPRGASCSGVATIFEQPANFKFGSMAGYLTLDECYAELADMAANYPDLITVAAPISGIKTNQGGDQFFVKISDNANVKEAEPEVLYTALHHAREPLGMQQLIFYMWYLLENYGTDPDVTILLDNLELYFVPVINPDGYEHNHNEYPDGGGLWRKNRRDNMDGTFGVDLNRNYGFGWGNDDTGSSPSGSSETYRGTEAFSEPETRGMKAFCEQHQFRLCLNNHTYGNLLIYPWGYLDGPTPDAAIFERIAEKLTSENNFKAGFATQTVGYQVNGTSDDWMYGEQTSKPLIFAFTPEVSNQGFWAPESSIVDWCQSMMLMNIYTAKFALDAVVFTDKSPKFLPTPLSGSVEFRLDYLGLTTTTATFSVAALSPNVASVGNGQSFVFDMEDFVAGNFQYTLAPTVMLGDEAWFEVTTQAGFFTKKDTLKKVYGAKTTAVFTDLATTTDLWDTDPNGAGWQTTTESFHSAPSSITDSPFAIYEPGTFFKGIFTKNTIQIPAGALGAQLRFWAKWDVEFGYDFVTCTANGTSLCGKYTTIGNNFLVPDEPVYEGEQADWVEECISLDGFAGQDVLLGFQISTDDFGEFDGFYFDDLVVEIFEPGSSRTVSLGAADFEMRAQPNPARETCRLSWEKLGHENGANLLIFNQLGELVKLHALSDSWKNWVDLPLEGFAGGVYFWKIAYGTGSSTARKLVVLK